MLSEDEMNDSALESPISSPTPEDRHKCPSCHEKMKQPMVLNCLHVFCLSCLEKQVEEQSQDGTSSQVIVCETCKHETQIPAKGISDLLQDYVLTDLIEMSDIEDTQIVCTSCKAKENAEARCQDCANFLCPNCVIAHQFMRCFENHKVITLEEMKKGNTSAVHRPIFCTVHPTENLKNYCKTCEVPICNDCLVTDHNPPGHKPERVQDLEEKEREYLKSLITEGKSKISSCEEASATLMSALGELQNQRDNAKDLINETFQSYKAILEKTRDDMLAELDTLQSSKELSLMDLCHNVEKAVEKLVDGCNFTEHVLNNGSALQLLLMKKTISSQLLSLINNTPNPEVNVNIDFKTDAADFETSVKKTFGSFKKEENKLPERPLSSLHSSFENEGFNLHSGILSPDTTIMPPVQNDFMSMPPVSTPGTIGEFNFQSLANIPPSAIPIGRSRSTIEGRCSRNSHSPAMSDSGISVDTGSTNSNSSAPLVNIAALAKLGTVGYSAQGQVTFNGQVVPGLNMSNISGMPPVSSRGPTPISEVGLPSSNRPQTPNLETLAGLLNRNNSNVLDTGNMDALGSFGLGATAGNITPNPGTLTPTFSSSGALSDSTSSMNTIGSNQSGMMNMTTGPPVRRANKMSAMQIRCKFGQLGPGKGQFNSPHGFCLGTEEDIIIADTNNHRIQVFEKTGEFKYQFGIPGREEGQLWYPRKVAVMRSSGKFIVCDRGNERSRMQIFTKNGHFVKKIAIRYIDIVAGLAITSQGHIVAVDSVSPTVFLIAEGGELIKWFDCSDYMREPSDIAINGKEYFVCDFKIVHIDRQTSRSFPVPLLLAVLTYLRFLATGGFQLTVADTVRLSQPTVSRLCQQVGRAISQMARQFITFPEGDAARWTKQIFGTLAGFPNVLGAIDCTHIWIKKPSMNPEDFIGRKGVPTINIQVVCDASFRITSAVVMWPGRTHDSRIWRQCALRARFEQGDHQGFLVADSGYQCTRYMLTPYLTPQSPAQVRYNTALCRTRVIVEQTFGVLKQRFQILRRKINLRPERACMHIKNAVILHNIGIERGDILAGVVQDAQVEENDQLEDVPADAAGRVMRDYITDSYFN